MKHALIAALLFSVLPAAAQMANGPTATPLATTEHQEVLAVSNTLIAQSMDLRPDGSARTTHQVGEFSTRVELKGLAIRAIQKMPLTDAERQAGVTRSYQAKVSCQSHRIWDGPLVAWSEWRNSGYGFFPSTIVVQEINGELVASAKRIESFSPGIDGTATASTR
jgi:hypothetical protein